MFGRLSKKAQIKNIKDHVDYISKRLDEKISDLREDIEVFRKVAHIREYRKVEAPRLCFFGDNASRQTFEEERTKARLEGFDFAYKYKNGDEIWVKYQEAK